ncbi:MAG: hypothetical protein A4E43_00838 [Methanosaeta sp. PtaB.Bin005]|nr:MAG: hypothetical protein A4E43_00838 [Methanosaeta sp. PtaB.Bin005]
MIGFDLIGIALAVVRGLLGGKSGNRHLHPFSQVKQIDIRIPLPDVEPGQVVAMDHGVPLICSVYHHRSLRIGGQVISINIPVPVSAISPDHVIPPDPGLGLTRRVGADSRLLTCGEVVEIQIPFILAAAGIDPDDSVLMDHWGELQGLGGGDLLFLARDDIIEVDLLST